MVSVRDRTRRQIALGKPLWTSPGCGVAMTSHRNAKLSLLPICVMLSTYVNSSDTREKAARISGILHHLHRSPPAPTYLLHKRLQNPQAMAHLQVQCVASSFVLISPPWCWGFGAGPSIAPPARQHRTMSPLPCSLSFPLLDIWNELEETSVMPSPIAVDTCHGTGQAKVVLMQDRQL